MNVTVENLAACRKLIRVEVDAATVDAMFAEVTKEFQKHASLPGFRPGKAPVAMVLKKHESDIAGEVKRKLVSKQYREAVEQRKIDPLGPPEVKETQFGRGQPMKFEAAVETAPEFALPEYKGIPARREVRNVAGADVEKALELLREQRAAYQTVERAAGPADILVVNYTGACDGKPVAELAPAAKSLAEQNGFWVRADGKAFLPGFGEQLAGAKAGERRTVNVQFPPDFSTAPLQGKAGVYAVEVVEVKEKVLPAVDEEFAKSFGAESLEKLREGVRKDLENELNHKLDRAVRNQVVRALLNQANFDLPDSAVRHETRNVVYDIVRENQQRGVTREMIEREKDNIYAAAAQGARERVKVSFLFRKIAEKEEIKVSNEEVLRRVAALAAAYQVEPRKFLQDLQKRDGLIEIYDQIAHEKVMDFLQKNAAIEEAPPGSIDPAPAQG